MAPMSVRRVGCKKSVPNRKTPIKKKLLAERIQDELQESLKGYAVGLPTSHQQLSQLLKHVKLLYSGKLNSKKIRDDKISGLEEDTKFSAEGGDSDVEDMPIQQDTAEIPFSAEEVDSDFEDVPLQLIQTYFSAAVGVSHLQNYLPLHHNGAAVSCFSVEGGDWDLQDMPLLLDITETDFSVEGGQLDLQDMVLQHDITETKFLTEGDKVTSIASGLALSLKSDSREISVQCDTAMTHFSAKGSKSSESYVPLLGRGPKTQCFYMS